MRPARLGLVGWCFGSMVGMAAAAAPWAGPGVVVEEVVARVGEANNGAGPLWCYGAPLLVRAGDDVWASIMEVGTDQPPPCNTRWRLLRRGRQGWDQVDCAAAFREREPCPLADAGRLGLLLSVNPAPAGVAATGGAGDPHLLRFDRGTGERTTVVRPAWVEAPRFAAHSYRGLGTDPARGEALVVNIDAATDRQCWAWLDASGRTARAGAVRFPIRACYPQVALRGGAGHILALGDVVEPVEAWRDHKRAGSGSGWDYVFRRLFYAEAPDLAAGGFAPPIEVDTVEATGGDLRNLDLAVDRAGVAHLLYLKTTIAASLRDRFFPGQRIATTLEVAVVERGVLARRITLVEGGEGRPETPQYARFHATADGALHVVLAIQTAAGLENRVMALAPDGSAGPASRLPLADPLRIFFTATERGGSPPSDTLDLLGQSARADDLRYARVQLR